MVVEQEIKLRVLTDKILDLGTLPCIQNYRNGEGERHHLISHYFDSDDLTLFNHGFGLRRRFNGQEWLQTLKDNGHVKDGLHQRQEWEHRLAADEFDLDLLRQTPLVAIIDDEVVWSSVKTLFSTDFIRYSWQLSLNNGGQVELAYDKGRVYLGRDEREIHELELELKAGDVSQLQEIAEQLMAVLPLEPSNISKAQQGYELVQRKLARV